MVYTYSGILAIKTDEIIPSVITRMDLEGILLSEVSPRKTHTV